VRTARNSLLGVKRLKACTVYQIIGERTEVKGIWCSTETGLADSIGKE